LEPTAGAVTAPGTEGRPGVSTNTFAYIDPNVAEDFTSIEVHNKAPVYEIILNRPEARNAITYPMEAEILMAARIATDDPAIKVITLRGNGKLFCAGHDLKEVAEGYKTVARPAGKPYRLPGLFGLWYCPKPIIAAVHEFVGPMGMVDLLAHCDFILAAEGTRFSFEQARFGGGNLSYSPIVFQLPPRVWMKMCMVGGWFDAEQALKWDFVQRVVPQDQLRHELDRWADQIAQVPIEQLTATKTNLHRQFELMGLANMALVQNQGSGHGDTEDKKFFEMVLEVGMKKALEFRQTDVDSEMMRV
jgi:enoyl-CoA hydratase/carnithine racemase